jgi:hypothetical protein
VSTCVIVESLEVAIDPAQKPLHLVGMPVHGCGWALPARIFPLKRPARLRYHPQKS